MHENRAGRWGRGMRWWSLIAIMVGLTAFEARAQSVLSTEGGRYVFGQLSEMRRDQYMLDTDTGRLWNIVTDSTGSKMLQPVSFTSYYFSTKTLEPMSVEDEDAALNAWIQQNSTPQDSEDQSNAADGRD